MAEKKDKEEYQLPEEEDFESHYEVEEVQTPQNPERAPFSVKKLLLNKKVLVPALIVFGVYGLYKFMEFRDKSQLEAQEVAQTPAPTKSISKTIEPAVIAAQVAEPEVNKDKVQMESLGTQLNQLKLTQTQMNSELSELSETVKTLTAKLEERSKVAITEPEVRPVIIKKKIKKYHRSRLRERAVVRPVAYHLRAVVPGRAWLESTKGRLFTVRIGERIVGYGIVEEIDVTRGVVITSSGREITYGKYDS